MLMNLSDQEQFEMLKKFWNEYGKFIILAVIVGLGLGYGWRFWQSRQYIHQQTASVLYFQWLSHNQISVDKKTATVELDQLQQQYSGSAYATFASFLVAGHAAQEGDYTEAERQLNWVIQHTRTDGFKAIAQIRLARVYANESKTEEALAMLAQVKAHYFEPMAQEVKGDIYHKTNHPTEAKSAYLSAKVGYDQLGLLNNLLSMKIASGFASQ